MELLEDRLTPSTLGGLNFTVTDNSDGATDPNSLRYALTQIDANGKGANNTITIDSTLIGGQTITLTSPLPQITANVAINGPGIRSCR